MKCGKSKKEIAEAKKAGCVIHDGDNEFITADRGSIQYPLNGNSYTNFEKCIWQIRPKTANKFLKVSQLTEIFELSKISTIRKLWTTKSFDVPKISTNRKFRLMKIGSKSRKNRILIQE